LKLTELMKFGGQKVLVGTKAKELFSFPDDLKE
jgi:hypothetical protein